MTTQRQNIKGSVPFVTQAKGAWLDYSFMSVKLLKTVHSVEAIKLKRAE